MASKQLAIIVGAGPGTGAAVSRAFAAKGYSVALLARSVDKLQSLSDQIKSEGGHAAPIACDVSSESSVKKAFAEIRNQFASLPLRVTVFNSSAPFHPASFKNTTASDFKSALDVSVMGAFHVAQEALPEMLSHGQGGSLLFTGATASLRAGAKLSAFATAKFGVRALSQSLAREYGSQGIHVAHVIIDGLINTDKVSELVGKAEAGKRIEPQSIANAFVYLHEQDPTCWSQELDLRPSQESF